MTRLSVRRKAPIKKVHRTIKRAKPAKKIVAVKARKKTVGTMPIYVPRIKTFLSTLNAFCIIRKKKFGAKDTLAKKLHLCHTSVLRECKKLNIVNPSMTKSFCRIKTCLKGVANVPNGIRMTYPKLIIFIRECVKRDVVGSLTLLKRTYTPMFTEMKKLETYFNTQLKTYKGKKVQFRIDPLLKRKHLAFCNTIAKFRTTWFKRLNTLALHGDKSLKANINLIKKHIDEVYKVSRRNQTIINRYGKAFKARKGYKAHVLFTTKTFHLIENKWKVFYKVWDTLRIKVDNFCDQLKAIKLFK